MSALEEAVATRLVLVRHGEAHAAVRQVVGGDTGCTGLSPLGVRQCELLRDRLLATGELADAGVLMASTLPRAVETARIIAPALGGLAVVQDRDLCELQPGECDGIPWAEYERRYGDAFRLDPFQPLSPGGESMAEFFLRVARTLHRIVAAHEGSTVVVACHGGVVEGSLRGFMGVPIQTLPTFDVRTTNASITEWQRAAWPGGNRWRLHRFNDAAHLSALARPEGLRSAGLAAAGAGDGAVAVD